MKNFFTAAIAILLSACASAPILLEATSTTKSSTHTPTTGLTVIPSDLETSTSIPTSAQTPVPTNSNIPAWPTGTPLPALPRDQPVAFTRIDMLDETTGWGVEASNHLLRTRDGGFTWQDLTPPEAGYYATWDSLHAWDIVQSRVSCQLIGCPIDWAPALVTWYTSNGGVSWHQGGFFLGGVPDFRPVAMQFVDDATGWFLYVDQVGMSGFTYQSLLGTTDGGTSWKLIQSFSNGCVAGGMVFLDGQNGWIGNDCRWLTNSLDPITLQDFLSGKAAPSLNQTLDGGVSWTEYAPPAPAVFSPSITSAEEDTGFYCGVAQMERISVEAFILQWFCTTGYPETTVSVGYAYLTDDGGQTWRSWLSTGNEQFIDPTTGWRLSPGSDSQPGLLQQTTDGGSTWQTIKTVAWQSAKFDFTSEKVGWAIVSDGTNFALVHTSDGGISWVELKPETNKQ